MFLRILCCKLCTIYPISGDPVWDKNCVDNCSCCIDKVCGEYQGYRMACRKGCIDGHRGARCYELCQYENCKSCGGQGSSNVCEVCYDGYYPGPKKDCTSQCPSNCKSCSSSTMCTECKGGFYDENGSTTCHYAHCPANCECTLSQGDCISCKKGFYDTSTSCSKQCPVSCRTCESEASCIECKSGFYNGYEYDNNINLQLNNCSFSCQEKCIQCQSYNKCLQCIKGKYGQTCQKECSVGCKDKSCLFDSGQCECTIGFTGDKCMDCLDGKYGYFCNQTCSKYCERDICKRMSGFCNDGCKNENITGNTCNACIVSMYGELCNKICSKNCKNRRCERFSGNCSEGCLGNFNGTMCDLCIDGKYGENCERNCPVSCAGGVCERHSGACFDCIGHFQGSLCDKCKSGYYRQSCTETCSLYCTNRSCDSSTGKCIYGCMLGYSGDKCCLKSDHCLECTNNTECSKCTCGFYTTTCNEKCKEDCLGSCNISTGKCSNCQYNRFGKFCGLNCSDRCKFEEGIHERVCALFDGTCINGCNDGYYGRACNKTCSRFCISGVCSQDDGICIKGCDGHEEERECLLSEEKQADESGTGKTFIILFAVSVAIVIVQGVFIFVKKRREVALEEASRQQSDVFYENTQMTTAPPLSPIKETNLVSANKTTVYEDMNRAEEQWYTADADEDYQKMRINHSAGTGSLE